MQKTIGEGGLSTVFFAINTATGEKVAIKYFKYAEFYDKITRTNDIDDFFDNEVINTQAQARSGLNCVRVLHYEKKLDLQTPEYYIVLSFIEGMTFLDFYRFFIQTCRGLQHLDLASIVRFIFIPLAKLLEYCHNVEQIIHRDFSVKNIIIQQNEMGEFWPVLIDWGVSKYVGPEWVYYTPKPYLQPGLAHDIPITQKGAPPEIKFGFMPVAASDIYYLAHLMYFVFTGGIIREDSEIDSADDYVLSPRSVNWYVPEIYDVVVQKMTQYEPADRPRSMKEVIELLENLIQIRHVHFDFAMFTQEPDTDPLTGEPIQKEPSDKENYPDSSSLPPK